MMTGGDMMNGGWMVLWAIGALAFWGSLIWLAVWTIRRFTGRPRGHGFRTLEQRFARGEIDAQEFETRRRVLES